MHVKRKKTVVAIIGVAVVLISCKGQNNKEVEVVEGTKENIVLENRKGEHALLNDGKYQAASEGYQEEILVEMTVEEGFIKKIKIKKHNEDQGVAGGALEKIPRQIEKQQSTNVDVISGATETSRGIIDAVNICIHQAGGV